MAISANVDSIQKRIVVARFNMVIGPLRKAKARTFLTVRMKVRAPISLAPFFIVYKSKQNAQKLDALYSIIRFGFFAEASSANAQATAKFRYTITRIKYPYTLNDRGPFYFIFVGIPTKANNPTTRQECEKGTK